MGETIDDEYVIRYFFEGKEKINRIKTIRIPDIIKDYLSKRFTDSESASESIWRIKLGLEIRPICKICGGHVRFNSKSIVHFTTTCGKAKCRLSLAGETNIKKYGGLSPFCSKSVRDKTKAVLKDRYGVENIGSKDSPLRDAMTQKCRDACQSEELKKRMRQTYLKSFGYESPLANPEIWKKTRESTIKHYGCAYNKEKYNTTILEKYGKKWYVETEQFIHHNKEISNIVQEKILMTKKKNNTFHNTRQEIEIHEKLSFMFDNVEREYKSEKYPFKCDFYIPEIDTYIEYNGFVTHGFHPFNPNDKADIETLEKWKSKQHEHPLYKNAIYTWTVLDVRKRSIAQQNNLNYLEFFNMTQFYEWLDNLNLGD